MNVRIAQLLTFNAGAWYNDSLEMNEYTVKLWMITNTYDDEEQNIAIRRLRQFIFDQLDSTIFIDSADAERCTSFITAGLNITTLPGSPGDQLIGIMLFNKLNAIMEDRIKILEIEISTGSGVIYLHSENETSEDLTIPSWWNSADLVHCELGQSENILSITQKTAWTDLDLAWPKEISAEETGNVLSFADIKKLDETK